MCLITTDIAQEAEEDFGEGKYAKHQKMLWDLIEHSESSKAAEVRRRLFSSFLQVVLCSGDLYHVNSVCRNLHSGDDYQHPWDASIHGS